MGAMGIIFILGLTESLLLLRLEADLFEAEEEDERLETLSQRFVCFFVLSDRFLDAIFLRFF